MIGRVEYVVTEAEQANTETCNLVHQVCSNCTQCMQPRRTATTMLDEQPDKLECFVPGNEESGFTSTDDRLDRKTHRNGADIQSMYLLY